MVLCLGCSDTQPPNRIIDEKLLIVEIDSIFVLGSDRLHQIAVQVLPAQVSEDRDMLCLITGGSATIHFRLYDDGSFGRWYDSVGFADSLTGDRVPGDGIFSRRITSGFAGRIGTFTFHLTLTGEPTSDTMEVVVTARENSPPQVTVVSHPDSVSSGASDLIFTAVVTDEDGVGDVAEVALLLFPNDTVSAPAHIFSLKSESTGDWEWNSLPGIAAGLATGTYPFLVRAADYVGLNRDEWEESEPGRLWLENLPPRITSVTGPDTVWISPDDTASIRFGYDILVYDDQSSTDLDTLKMLLTRADSVRYLFYYLDDGEGDAQPFDGRYFAGFTVNNSNTTGVTHTFDWTPHDKTGQAGSIFHTQLTLMSGDPPDGARQQPGLDENRATFRQSLTTHYRKID